MNLAAAYTLVVPTYNRPRQLASLLRYLERDGAEFRVLVLDSSLSEHRDRNKKLVGELSLRTQYLEFDRSIHPFDKFREGLATVETPFCALCADDDLVILQGVRRCVEHLERHPDVCVAHGYYFMFLECAGGARVMDLVNILYYAPSIDSVDPVSRLRQLFRNYQALTYGTYRTPVLRHIFETVKSVESLLARELLSSALAIVQGKAVRLPNFTNGRSQGASEAYRFWHPLEWLIEWPQGLFAEYMRYRDILVSELMRAPAYGRSLEVTQRTVDLIHMFYLIRHTPQAASDFILDHVMGERNTYEFWPAMEIQLPLIDASEYVARKESSASPLGRTADRVKAKFRMARRHLLLRVGLGQSTGSLKLKELGVPAAGWPKLVKTEVREYRLHERFLRPQPADLFTIPEDEVVQLLGTMDKYRTEEEL